VKIIEKLTPEQEKYLPLFRDEWLKIGLDTTSVDRANAESAIGILYEWGGFKRPQFIHLSSPMMCELFINLLCNRDQLGGQLRDQLRGQLWDQLGGQLWGQLGGQLRDQLGGQLWGQKLKYMGTWFWGQQDAYWVAWLEFGRLIGAQYDPKNEAGLGIWNVIARECHWFYPFLEFCIISDKPTVLQRDERGLLHNPDGQALGYRDGWGLYAVHGVFLPGEIIEHPESVTVQRIEAEENAEIRRVMLEKYGLGRYLMDSGAKEIHHDETGILYRKPIDGDEPLVMVRVVNSTPEIDGSSKEYFLRVPPDTKTAREGVAWTFDMPASEYAPEVQS
jgi:hypothetical protein